MTGAITPKKITYQTLVGFFPDHLAPKQMSFVQNLQVVASLSVDDKPVPGYSKSNYCSTADAQKFIRTMEDRMQADGYKIQKNNEFDSVEIAILKKNYFKI